MESFIAITLLVMSIHIPTLLIVGADVALVGGFGLLHGRRPALRAAAGVTVGSAIMVLLALIFHETIQHLPPLALQIIRYLGAGYLLFLAVSMLLPSKTSQRPGVSGHPFVAGLLTEITNPKTILFFLTVFTLVGRQSAALPAQVYAGGLIILFTGVYYTCLAMLSSQQSLIKRLSRHTRFVQTIAAAIFIISAALLVLV